MNDTTHDGWQITATHTPTRQGITLNLSGPAEITMAFARALDGSAEFEDITVAVRDRTPVDWTRP